MKVFVVGGTGFIGYYTTLELLKKGYEVATISLPDIELGDWFPKGVKIHYGDIFKMPETELKALFEGYDAMIYSVGPDDRVKPQGNAYQFFHERLVKWCGKVVAMAREAGVKRCVVTNSYFAYFARINPERKLTEHHPYIRCRVEQAERVISEGKDMMDVMVLELPYIFGCMPERVPLWKDILVSRLAKGKKVYYPKGGSNMIAVEHVAEAIVGAIENGKHGKRYPIGDVNMSWIEMLQLMLNSMNMSNKKIVTVPSFIVNLMGRKIKKEDEKSGFDAGLDPLYLFRDIMCKELYFDPTESVNELGYGRGGIEESIDKTIKACIKDIVI
jgi:nucleoside-diphosphate-sugar epimerase